VLLPVVDILRGDAADQRVTGVTVGQQRADGEQDLGDREGGTPLVLQDVQAYYSLAVHVAVVDPRPEFDLGRLEGVVCGEVDIEKEDTALVHGAGRTQDGRHPLVQVVALGPGATVGWRVEGDGPELLLNPLGGGGERLRHLGSAFLLFGFFWCLALAGRLRHI